MIIPQLGAEGTATRAEKGEPTLSRIALSCVLNYTWIYKLGSDTSSHI